MISKGYWTGSYTFQNKQHQFMLRHEQTNFEIIIQTSEQDLFTGIVQDDLSTGGTAGIGEIKGKVRGDKIEFTKQMPIMTLLIDRKGTRKTINKKHRKIYYSGTFSQDKKSLSGEWKFKFGFIWMGIFPVPIIPTNGNWTMQLNDDNRMLF